MKDFLACRADAVALKETDQTLAQCLGRNSEQSAVVLLGLCADQVQKIDAEYSYSSDNFMISCLLTDMMLQLFFAT